MEETPSKKELSELVSTNCASSSRSSPCKTRISRCSSQNTPKSSADEDETVSTGMPIKFKEGMAIKLKEEGAAIELEEGANIDLKEEMAALESKLEEAAIELEETANTDLKHEGMAIELKDEGAAIDFDEKGVTINLEEKGVKTGLKEGMAIDLMQNRTAIKMRMEGTTSSQQRDYENAIKLKKEGTRLFQKRDYEGAAFTFDKAIQLLPKEHDDIAFLHCNIAACYMHMIPEAYDRAINECNWALEASPKYTKALLKRARCFEALDRLDLAYIDVQKVLSLEPNNVTALELFESLKEEMEQTDNLFEKQVDSLEEPSKTIFSKEKIKRKISRKFRNSIVEEEVWLIHDEEMQDNDEDSKEDKCNETNHIGNDLKNEQSHTNEHNRDDNNRYTEGIHLKHGQYKLGANDQGQLHNASDGMEEMQLKQKPTQNKHENPLKEIKVRSGQHEQEMHTKQNQVSRVEKHQKKTEDIPATTHRKHDGKHTEMYESYIDGNQEKHSLERLITRADQDKQDKQTTTNKPACHGRDKHQKCIGENHKDVTKGEMKPVKFVLGEDIRIVVVQENCSLIQLTNIARLKYSPHLKAMHLKFKDLEGDLVTITSTEELRWVEDLNPQRPPRLYIKEVSPDREITRDIVMPSTCATLERNHSISECGSSRHAEEKSSPYADDWMMQFARLFKNHVGFDSDTYVDLRDLGMRLYYEAMEETITSEEAQEIFQAAEAKFQEMAAVALFNWGNIHMSRAKKRIYLSEDASKESVLAQVKKAYEWACAEYIKAGKKFEDTVDVKPDFYDGLIALANQQFEQAKLAWRYADACKADMGTEVLELFNHAEDNMEKGMEMWEGIEHLRIKGIKSKKEKILLDKLGLNGHLKDLTADEAVEEASNMRSQLNISWGTILYERSVVEFKLGLSSWEESLTEAIEKFKTGGASLADISVMIKNHCANEKTQEGLSFKIDEIVQAWNEMYDAKKLKNGSSSFRLEPLFRRKPSKLHNILEHIQYT